MKKSKTYFAIRNTLAIGILLGLILIWWNWQFLLTRYGTITRNVQESAFRGQYGDSYGSLNALFTGLAFVGLVCTIFLQIEERLGHDEEQKTEHFESILFRLIDMWRDYVASLEWDHVDGHRTLRAHRILDRIHEGITACANGLYGAPPFSTPQLLESYKQVYNANTSELDSYFRTLYRAFRHIYKSSQEDKLEYSNIIRAVLTPQELVLLSFNCLTSEGEDFKEIVEEFHLLKHLRNPERTALIEANVYRPEAFGP